MKSFFERLREWLKKLGHELYVVLSGALGFLRDEPLSSMLAIATFIGLCVAGVLENKMLAAAVLMVSTMLYGMLKYRVTDGVQS